MDEHIETIVETVLLNRSNMTGRNYYGGAKQRIIAQIPKGLTTKEELIDELEKAFKREENCYF